MTRPKSNGIESFEQMMVLASSALFFTDGAQSKRMREEQNHGQRETKESPDL